MRVAPSIAVIGLLFASAVAIRVAGPADLRDSNQYRQVGYVMDILVHGDWLVQYETTGDIATKPPLYNWIAAAACKVFHSRRPWILRLPSFLSALGTIAIVWCLAARLLGARAPIYAALATVSAHQFLKNLGLARTDMLMTFLVHLAIATIVLARPGLLRAILAGSATGLAALAKGPIGPALVVLFLAVRGLATHGYRARSGWYELVLGSIVAGLISGTWLYAVWEMPQFQERVVRGELEGHAIGEHNLEPPWYYFGYLATRIGPWAYLALVAPFVFRRRHQWPRIRFLCLWAGAQFVLFSLMPAKGGDYLLPVYPAFFLLAGATLEFLFEPAPGRGARWLVVPLGAVFAAGPLALLGALSERLELAPLAVVVASAIGVAGVSALLSFRRGSRTSIRWIAAGIVLTSGLVTTWVDPMREVDDERVELFAREVRRITGGEEFVVFQAHPIVSYALGVHDIDPKIEDLAARRVRWVVCPGRSHDTLANRQPPGSVLVEERLALVLSARKYAVDLRLMRVSWPPLPDAPPDAPSEERH